MTTSAQDFLVAKFALRASLLATEDLQRLLEEQRQQAGQGRATPLVQLLAKHRLLSREQVVALMRAVEATSFDCERCHEHHAYAALTPGGPLACPRCKGPLKIVREDGESVSERLVTGRRGEATPRPVVNAGAVDTLADSRVPTRDQSGVRHTLDSAAVSIKDSQTPVPRGFGPFEILAELGRGGMGVVYKARDPKGRVVALKVLLAGNMASKTQIKRFQREAELAGKLQHPGIVPIFDIGQIDDRHYFTMEFVEGKPLEEHVKARELSVRQAVEITRDIARALAHAHANGVVHRDVKPANIIIDLAGRPHMMDFGLAKDLEGDSPRLTREGAAVGTPFYMAPEQATGDRAAIGPHSDIYSLGVVCFELLTFDLPFKAVNQAELTKKILNDAPPRPTALEPAIDPDVELVVLKALAKAPQDRYATADAMADDLDRWLAGESVGARPTGLVNVARAYWRAHAAQIAPVLVVVGLLGAIGTGTTLVVVRLQRLRREREEAETRRLAELAAQRERELREKAERDAQKLREQSEQSLREATVAFGEVDRIPSTETALLADKLAHLVALANEALASDASNAKAYFLRGRARELARQPDDALVDYKRARELDPKASLGAEATYRAARITLRRARDAKAAINLLEEIEPRGAAAGVWRHLARAQRFMLEPKAKPEQARAELDQARVLDPTSPDVYFARALTFLAEGSANRPKDALENLNACLDGDRKNARAYALRARCQLLLGHDEVALQDLRTALAIDPDDALALGTRSAVAQQSGRVADAIQDLRHIAKTQEPNEDPDVLLDLASVLARNGQSEEARTTAARARTLAPETERPYGFLARLQANEGHPDLAVAELRAGLERCSKNAEIVSALVGLGMNVLVHAQRFDEAERFVSEQLGRTPDSPAVKLALGEVYALRDRGDDSARALEAFEDLHAKSPAFIDAWKSHAHFLLVQKKRKDAAELAKRLLSGAPKSAEAWLLASSIYELAGQHADSKEAARQAADLDPRSARAQTQLAQLAYMDRDWKTAETFANAALELDPTFPGALTILGAVAAQTNRPPQDAVNYLNRALESDPNDADAAYILAMVMIGESKYEVAVRVAERTLLQSSGEPSPKLYEALGIAQLELGRLPEAERALKRSLEKDDTSPQAHAAMAELLLRRNESARARTEAQRALQLDAECMPAQKILELLDKQAPRSPVKRP